MPNETDKLGGEQPWQGPQQRRVLLADRLKVCRSSIGNAIRETRLLLEQAGHTSIPASTRYRTATELLASVTLATAPATTGTSPR